MSDAQGGGKVKKVPVRPWERRAMRSVRYCLEPGCGEMIYFFRGKWRHVSQELDHDAVTTLYVCDVCQRPVQKVRHRNRYVYLHADGERFYDHKAIVTIKDLDDEGSDGSGCL